MYVVTIGGGEIGSYVARGLIEETHEVGIVEQDDPVRRRRPALDAMVIEGSGVGPPIL